MKKYHKEYYLKNKTVILARSAERYLKNKSLIRKQSMDRYYSDLVGVMIDRVKQRARKLNIPFNLTRKDVIIPELCPVFGIKLERSLTGVPKANSPSLDRIEPQKGYVSGNIQVISYKANVMKSNASSEELLQFAEWIYKGTLI